MKTYQRSLLILGVTCLAFLVLFISFGEAQNSKSSAVTDSAARKKAGRYVPPSRRTAASARALLKQDKEGSTDGLVPYSAPAVAFIETPAVRDLQSTSPSPSQVEKVLKHRENQEKNANNVRRVKPDSDPSMTGPFADPTLLSSGLKARAFTPNLVTAPLQNFAGPDMDQGAVLFGGRFAPPDTNAAVGPNHVVITCNAGFQVFSKTGVALTPLTKISTLLAGIPGAADDDGDPIVLYDGLADRWLISQFRLTLTNNSTHEHVAISKTSDPTGAYFAYDFLLTPNRVGDYPHLGVWPDGYYMATNDFNTSLTAFLGAGLYSLERTKMLAGDPTAKIIGFNTPPTDGGMLPTNLQGFSAPPVGTPNLFIEFDADEFGALTDLIRVFEFRPNYVTPASSTLTQLADIPTAPFDARQPATRAVIAQPAPGEGLDSIADRLMHAMNFRVLPGGQQSIVLNWTVNVSGVNPTNSATYQGGVRWMELRRNSGTGAITINQQATYAPGSGNPTGRDLWMASVAQDGEGNIALAASASNSTATPALLNPTALYTGRLPGDPVNTLPQGEVDALSAVTKGVQTATANRWGDYSSLFADPADDCTFWGAFEYVDSPTATFDWNTRLFSFKVNPTCVTPERGSFSGVITNCSTGLPIEGAVVQTADGFLRTTDASGAYSFSNVAPGTYQVTVSKTGGGFNTATGNVTVTNGGNAIFNACLQGVPIIVAAGSTITAESCSPADGSLSPGETVTVSFGLKNGGAAPTTNLVATLQATGGVTSPSGPQNYGAIPPDNTTVVTRPFTFTVDPSKACGDTVTATLQLQDGPNNLGTVTFTMQVGSPGAPVTATYSSGNIAVPIPDVATVEVPINVPDNGVVQDVNVRVRLNHTFDGDLVISLVHPDGTVRALANNRGGSGANYGTGANDCSGTPTVFDDEAAVTIASGVAPFAGSFRPDAPLSGFDGKPSSGTWKLRVSDTAALDVGTIGCVQLVITRAQFVCCGVAGTPNIEAGPVVLTTESCPPANNAIDPGESVTVNLELHNNGTAATSNLVATLQTGGGVTSPSPPQSYGVLTTTGPGSSATRDFSFTAAGVCGGTITATWQLQDGPTNLGTVTKTFVLGTTVNSTTTFSNPAPILIPATGTSGPAAPYPSTINVAGVVGPVSKVTVTLKNMNHTFPEDVDVLLVGPGGQKLLLMSDAGGSADVVNVTYTFDDTAAASLATTLNASGTYKPTNFGTGDTFPAPAPVGPYPDPQLLSVFNGVNPNGTWSLYVFDDVGGDVGNINLGWELNITTSTPVCTTPCGVVRLVVSSTLSRVDATTVKATYRVQNTGTVIANNVMLTTAQLGATNGTPLPQALGSIAPGTFSSFFDVFFTNSTPGASSTLKLDGTYTGGTFNSTKRVTIP